MCILARNWVGVPFFLEAPAVFVDCIKKQKMKKPEMGWLTGIEAMQVSETSEKRPPAAHKMGPDLDPQTFRPSVLS